MRGRANLLENVTAQADIELLKHLFEDLETQDGLIQLLDLAEQGSGVRIFIGSENKLFSLSGSSLVVAPYRDKDARVVGALGVIGPTRLNYARIVPMVDYTAQMVMLACCRLYAILGSDRAVGQPVIFPAAKGIWNPCAT